MKKFFNRSWKPPNKYPLGLGLAATGCIVSIVGIAFPACLIPAILTAASFLLRLLFTVNKLRSQQADTVAKTIENEREQMANDDLGHTYWCRKELKAAILRKVKRDLRNKSSNVVSMVSESDWVKLISMLETDISHSHPKPMKVANE